MTTGDMTVHDLMDILKRRKWSLLLPAAALFLVAASVAFILPPIYRSTTTILIEEQEIPPEMVASTVTSFAEQRLQVLNQRIMSSTRLLEIINRFNLYADIKEKITTEEMIEKMRKDIKFDTISADVIDRRTGRPTQATIAFSLSYSAKNPATAQQIANVLASLYLEENLKVREQSTSGTSKFLEDEMKDVQAKLVGYEAQISAYKQRNLNSLPELVQTNLSELDQVERSIIQFNDQLRTLKEKEGYLRSQLANITPEDENQDKTRLNDLKAKLVNLKSRFSDEYPDVKKLQQEIATLEKQLHTVGGDARSSRADNPNYVNLASQLAGAQSEIDSVKRQIAQFADKRDSYRKRIQAAPKVEEGFKNLMVERNNMQLKYDDLSKKYLEAKVAHGLEKEQMGERFTIVDAARLPEKPVSPNVPVIMLIGLILGIGSGVGVATIRETGDKSVHSMEVLAKATMFPVLAAIPEIVTWQDQQRQLRRRRSLLVAGIMIIPISLLAIHFLVMDLSVAWAIFKRRMAL